MKTLKRLTILLLCGLMLLGITACGSKPADTPDTGANTGTKTSSSETYDYDFTKMGQSVAYSQLTDFMNEPTKYLGKTMKISGVYYAQPSEDGKTTYYYITLSDTTACCSAYIEFLSDSGKYPEKSSDPNNNQLVTITCTGVVDSYEELGQTYYVLRTDSIA